MTADFEDRAKCYLVGVALEATVRDAVDQLDEHIDTLTHPTKVNRFTGGPISESLPDEVDQTQDAGEALIRLADEAMNCADGTQDALASFKVIGEAMKSVGPSHEVAALHRLRLDLVNANITMYCHLTDAGL